MIALLCALAGIWGTPGWYPRGFWPVPTTGAPAEFTRYLATEDLDIEPAIHRTGTVRSLDREIACHLWIPSNARGTVFLVHGMYNHSGTWSPHIRRILGLGLAVATLDLPGHGLSDGRWMDIDSIAEYSLALRALEDSLRFRAPLPWTLVGHSLGGTVVLDRAAGPEYPYARTILVSPLVHYAKWGLVGAALPPVALFKDHMARGRNLTSSTDTTFRNRLLSDPLEGWQTGTRWLRAVRRWNGSFDRPTATTHWHLLQGETDATVDWKYDIGWLRGRIPDLDATIYPEGHHHLLNDGAPSGPASRAKLDSILRGDLPRDPK